eukprot:1014725-Pelagomonas_calceolata.AAC.2
MLYNTQLNKEVAGGQTLTFCLVQSKTREKGLFANKQLCYKRAQFRTIGFEKIKGVRPCDFDNNLQWIQWIGENSYVTVLGEQFPIQYWKPAHFHQSFTALTFCPCRYQTIYWLRLPLKRDMSLASSSNREYKRCSMSMTWMCLDVFGCVWMCLEAGADV